MDDSCAICGKPADHIHHIVYRSRWKEGADVKANLLPLCASCHEDVHAGRKLVPIHYKNRAILAKQMWVEKKKASIHFVDVENPPEEIPARSTAVKKIFKYGAGMLLMKGHYGDCRYCGESDPEKLHLHHAFLDGAEHRGKFRGDDRELDALRDVERSGYPKDRGYQVLCYRCHSLLHSRFEGGRGLYIAGKISGNDRASADFWEAEKLLFDRGYAPWSPMCLSVPPDPKHWSLAMRSALAYMLKMHGVASIPGWKESRGASIEARLAQDLDIPWKDVEEWV